MMSLQLYMALTMIMAWSMLSSNNPMTLSLIILTMAISSSMMFNLLLSTWYAMIMFLIYIGGLMVMFSYFVSFNSNNSMWLKSKLQFILLPLIMTKNLDMQITVPMCPNLQLLKLYYPSNMVMMMIITMILLYMMIIVVKMVKSVNGPLRGHKLN